jgi:hypothetical protein
MGDSLGALCVGSEKECGLESSREDVQSNLHTLPRIARLEFSSPQRYTKNRRRWSASPRAHTPISGRNYPRTSPPFWPVSTPNLPCICGWKHRGGCVICIPSEFTLKVLIASITLCAKERPFGRVLTDSSSHPGWGPRGTPYAENACERGP